MSAVSSSLRSSSYENSNNRNGSRRRHTRNASSAAAEVPKESSSSETNDNSNLVKLCINKPKSWNWELTTSKSSPSIAFPTIQLFDKASGALLAETNEADCQIRGQGSSRGGSTVKTPEKNRRKSSSQQPWRANIPEIIAESRDEELLSGSGQKQRQLPLKVSHSRSRSWQDDGISSDKQRSRDLDRRGGGEGGRISGSGPSVVSRSKSATLNTGSIGSVPAGLDEVLNGIVDRYAKEGVNCQLTFHRRTGQQQRTGSCERTRTVSPIVDQKQYTKQLRNNVPNYPLGKSKSTTYVPITKAASNSSCSTVTGQRKKKYRRAQSVNSLRFSNSILERIREYKRCTSSSEDDEDVPEKDAEKEGEGFSDHLSPCGTMRRKIRMVHSATDIPAEQAALPTAEDVYRPKYTLRTSKAGTIVVCEESFRHRKVRRRPRSLTRTNEDGDEDVQEKRNDEVIVFSPERVKTKFEYIGRAEEEEVTKGLGCQKSGSESRVDTANRYQREIDNIDKMLEKLKEEAQTGKNSSSSAMKGHRRHKSMPDPVTVSANSKALEDNDPIRFNSHHHHQRSRDLLLSSTSINGQRQKEEEEETVDTNRQKMDQIKAKRISFGRTTFKTRSTDEPEMDINDVDNRVRRKTNGVNDQDPEGTVGMDRGSQLPLCSVGGDISDRDKSWAKRKQVRGTRRSSSADCTRMNDWVLSSSSSSSSSSSGSDDAANDEDNRTANNDGRGRRGRSRTRKKKPQKRTQQDEGSSNTHKLIVQGKPQIPRRPVNINLFKGNYINLFFFFSQSN